MLVVLLVVVLRVIPTESGWVILHSIYAGPGRHTSLAASVRPFLRLDSEYHFEVQTNTLPVAT